MFINASIVTYNHTIDQISDLIATLTDSQVCGLVYIIDNSPHDYLRKDVEKLPKISYIFTGNNIGFGAAHNIAIVRSIESGVNYHFVVNPDIHFQAGVIEQIIKFMNQDVSIGQLMPKILNTDKSVQHLPKLLPSPFDLLIRRLGLFRRLFSFQLEKYELKNYSNQIFCTPVISGCFSCIRVEALQRVGLFDDNFFMYFEDFDLSRRINQYYKTIYFSEAQVYHEYERGAQKNPRLFIIFIKSAVKYFNKWGWFFDKERREINRRTLAQFK